jgi:hypothetical protein
MANGEGLRLERPSTTRVSAIVKAAVKELGIKGRFTLRSSARKLNPNSTLARAGGKDPEWVERVWKLEPVARTTAKRRKR